MLSADEIADLLEHPDGPLAIVPCPDLNEVRRRGASSIDLRLGRWFLGFRQTRSHSVGLMADPKLAEPAGGRPRRGDHLAEHDGELRTREYFVPFGEQFTLHPGRFVLGVTFEWLQFPKHLSAYVTGKSRLGRHGLVIETAAGVHPGFSGCLTLELANVGEVPLVLYPGMEICQVFIHRSGPKPTRADETKRKDKLEEQGKGHFSGHRKPILLRPEADSVLEALTSGGRRGKESAWLRKPRSRTAKSARLDPPTPRDEPNHQTRPGVPPTKAK